MQRRPFARKPLHASPSSSRKSLDEVKRAVDTCLQNPLHSKEDGVQNALSLLDQLESNAFKQSPMEVEEVIGSIFCMICSVQAESSPHLIELLLSACTKHHFCFSESFCLRVADSIPNSSAFRVVASILDSQGKQLSSECLHHLASVLFVYVMNSSLPAETRLLSLLCFSNLIHVPRFTIPPEQSELLLQTLLSSLQPFPTDEITSKIHSISLHLLCFLLQHPPRKDALPDAYSALASSLLHTLTTTSHPHTKYNANVLQFLRLVETQTPSTRRLLPCLTDLLRLTTQWAGEVSLTHECLTTLRTLLKKT
ncbi:hypothetical protein WA577_000913, partial [Blastocystis sp. JDR]